MDQYIQVAGAILVLLGYALGQTGRLDARSRGYLSINLVGSGLLALNAFDGRQWGFLVLNGVWAIISLINLLRSMASARQDETGI